MLEPEYADNGDGTWKATVGAGSISVSPITPGWNPGPGDYARTAALVAGPRPGGTRRPGPHVRMPPPEKELSRQPYCRHDRPMTSLIDLLPTTAADRSVRGRQQRDRRRRPTPDHA
ncbi:hypothetical protein [Streptomyces puniciscabiei]|uniref:hypothetical protein n=1 Tax=Streptomyces puniciscabiei TaxID=164348 RepID=UPI003324D697